MNNFKIGAVCKEALKIIAVVLCCAVYYGGYGPTLLSWASTAAVWIGAIALVLGYLALVALVAAGCWFGWLIYTTLDVEWTPFWSSRHKGESHYNVARDSVLLPSHLAEEETFLPPSNSFEPASGSFRPATQWRPDRPRNTATPSLRGCGPTQRVCPRTGNVTHTYADGTVVIFDKTGSLVQYG